MLQSSQLGMHLIHEAMKVAPAALGKRQTLVEEVHQPGLATSDAAPQVQALLYGVCVTELADQAGDDGGLPLAGLYQALAQVIEARNDCKLRWIGSEAA